MRPEKKFRLIFIQGQSALNRESTSITRLAQFYFH